MRAFKCHHSDLLLPGDYVKEWGKKYGIGLGPEPRSDILDSSYHLQKGEALKPGSGLMMHPVGICFAGLTEVEVTEDEFNQKKAIMHHEDPNYTERMKIMMDKQKKKALKVAEDAYLNSKEESLK